MRNGSNKSVFFKMSPVSSADDRKAEISDIPVGGSFKSVLLRWRRSVYQLIWKHLLIYALTYMLLSILYQFILNEDGKKNFRVLAEHCSGYSRSINLMIMLGFFTSTTMQRLFNMQITIPGTAKSITMFILSLKPGLPEGPIIIEKYARWQVLTWVLTFRLVCKPLRTIYPDLMSLQNAGLLTQEEREVMESPELTSNTTPHPLIVVDWMLLLLKETFLKSRYFSEINHLKNVEIIMAFKKSCGNTIKFATQNISPALIQAVILAVYGFGCITLMARNFSKEDAPISDAIVAYIPLMPGLQFFVYFAWLCFGRAAVDPFGDDEDDINVKQLVQSHIEDSMRLRDLYSRQLMDIFPKSVSLSFLIALYCFLHWKSLYRGTGTSYRTVTSIGLSAYEQICNYASHWASVKGSVTMPSRDKPVSEQCLFIAHRLHLLHCNVCKCQGRQIILQLAKRISLCASFLVIYFSFICVTYTRHFSFHTYCILAFNATPS